VNRLSEFPEICLKHYTSRFLCPWNPHTHDYLGTYMEVLANREIKKIVEFGLGPAGLFHPKQIAGCGVRMWAETFTEAEIYGLDYDRNTLVNSGRIKSFLCDQKSEYCLSLAVLSIGGGIDFMVDDASHKGEDQLRTILAFMPYLSPDGLYVVEDVLLEENLSSMLEECKIPHRVVELRTNVLPDDRLIIIEKKDCP
jgi:hypothetical protein